MKAQTRKPLTKPVKHDLGRRLKSAREAAGMEPGELAKLLGIPYSSLMELESGRIGGTTRIARLAAVLRVNPFWLETGRGPRALDPKLPLPSLADIAPLTDDEARLLAVYRNANPAVQGVIAAQVEQIASLTKSPPGKAR